MSYFSETRRPPAAATAVALAGILLRVPSFNINSFHKHVGSLKEEDVTRRAQAVFTEFYR